MYNKHNMYIHLGVQIIEYMYKLLPFIQQYLAWRVMTGLHHEITMSFMLVGHTKFSPDWCFGLFKERYQRTFVSSLDDIVEVVNTSADVNVAQLVGSQDGASIVPVYNWVPFLREHFRHLPKPKIPPSLQILCY